MKATANEDLAEKYKAVWNQLKERKLPYGLDLFGDGRVCKRSSKKRKLEK